MAFQSARRQRILTACSNAPIAWPDDRPPPARPAAVDAVERVRGVRGHRGNRRGRGGALPSRALLAVAPMRGWEARRDGEPLFRCRWHDLGARPSRARRTRASTCVPCCRGCSKPAPPSSPQGSTRRTAPSYRAIWAPRSSPCGPERRPMSPTSCTSAARGTPRCRSVS